MPRLKIGAIPRVRLKAARAVRDALAEPLRDHGGVARVTLVRGSFGVEVVVPAGSDVSFLAPEVDMAAFPFWDSCRSVVPIVVRETRP